MDAITRFVIVPLIFASLATGLIQSFGTHWGLFQHYWVLAKLLLTVFATVVLLLQVSSVHYVANLATQTGLIGWAFWEERLSFVVHASGGALVLLLAVMLSVFKPRGVIPYRARR